MKSYYYVYKHGDQGPRVRHHDLATAQKEAERLAVKEPGRFFEILRCVGYSSTSKASTFWMDGEGPPEKPRYRELEDGEKFREGDQYFPNGEWMDVPYWSFGETYDRRVFSSPHRRPL